MTAGHGQTPHCDDISGATLDGAVVRDVEVFELIRAAGLLTIVRGPADRLRRCGWADEFSAFARDRGMLVHIRDAGRLVLILDIESPDGATTPPEVTDPREQSRSRAAHPTAGAWPRMVPAHRPDPTRP